MAGIKNVIDTLDKAADDFDSIANAEQKKIYEEVITLAKDLETDILGRVKQTITNLKRLNQIKAKLAALSKDKEWVAGIGQFVKYFYILQRKQNEYFSSAFPKATLGETAKKRNEMMKQIAVNNTIEALMGDGLKANVTDKLNDILLRGVTSGAKWADLQQELRDHLMGKDGGQGAFARYATTYATTALSQYTGQHNQLMTKDLGLEWFMYTGSNIETTRPFCEALTKKKWVHKSEIPTILQGKITMQDGEVVEVEIYDKTGLPKGMIAGTTPENFQCNCGGWNCRHQLIPVADAVVPKQIRDRLRIQQKISEATKPLPAPAKNVLYSSVLPYAPQIIEKLEQLHTRMERQKLFEEIINDDAFNLQFSVGESKTVVHPDHKGKKSDSWESTLAMAKDINNSGSDVAFLAENDDDGGADAIAKMFGEYTIVEFKHSESTKPSTVAHLLLKGFKQGENIALKIENMGYSELCDAIDYLIRNKHKVGNLKLINKNGKTKDIYAKDVKSGKYKQKIRGFL